MNNYEAKVVADSIAPNGIRLTTMLLTYPRYVHAELMTHRCFSRNAASSRAIPTSRKIKRIRDYPVEPPEWGSKQKGMQAGDPIGEADEQLARDQWHRARLVALDAMEKLDSLNVHKQIANRIGEPWDWITTLVTSTKWRNFDFLRIHPAADPAIRRIAKLRKEAYDSSTPKKLFEGQWHLPFVKEEGDIELLKKLSAARCARLSYLNHEGNNATQEEDLNLFNRLTSRSNPENDPGHWTPLEHQATPMTHFRFVEPKKADTCDFCFNTLGKKAVYLNFDYFLCNKCSLGHITSGNFVGWHQHRKEYPFEDFDAF